ncbi:Uncharacterised protein [uncultured archaeon]|nr:Uncharacterised protein [uncultured archaeon]
MYGTVKTCPACDDYVSAKQMWIDLVDPAVEKDKSELARLLRAGLSDVTPATFEPRRTFKLFSEALPKNTIAAVLMSGGYAVAQETRIDLSNAYGVDKFIYPGYSTGFYSEKQFKDGSPMEGKVYMLEDDIRTVQKNPTAPLLFIDDVLQTGATVGTMTRTLSERLGHSGEFYLLAANKWRRTDGGEFECEVMRCEDFMNKRMPVFFETYARLTEAREIVTENGNIVKDGEIVEVDQGGFMKALARKCVRRSVF